MKENSSSDTTRSEMQSPIQRRVDGHWKQLTNQGNKAFARGDFREAQQHYERAWLEARSLFDRAASNEAGVDADPAPMLVVSAANMAENFARSGASAQSETHLREVITLFTSTLLDPLAPTNLRRACLVHMHRALLELVPRMQANRRDENEIAALVASTKEIALASMHDLKTPN